MKFTASSSKTIDNGAKDAVLGQLELVLAHVAFKNSSRCVNLLRYVVEHTLQGDKDPIKERTLGVEVFGRDAAYDSNQDPIVRVVASDVRKRIAQYYQEPGHEEEIRIHLNSGSYIPEFQFPDQMAVSAPLSDTAIFQRSKRWQLSSLAVIFLVLVVSIVGLLWRSRSQRVSSAKVNAPEGASSALDSFWLPILSSPDRISLSASLPQKKADGDRSGSIFVSAAYASMFSQLSEFLGRRGHGFDLRIYNDQPSPDMQNISHADIQNKPAIFIGELTNPGIIEAKGPQRYALGRKPGTDLAWIEDRQNPSSRAWTISLGTPPSNLAQDYAIVLRIADPEAGRMYIGGFSETGTIALVECLMDAKCMKTLVKDAPKGWSSQNLEVVVAIPIVSGNPGPPLVLATDSWKTPTNTR